MIALLLFWNVAPYAAMAGTFITPGEAMNPGKAYKPGQPIQGGQFIIPGKVYNPGDPLKPGEAGGASGTPIIPQGQNPLGLFIIPNVPPPPPGSFYWEFIGIEGGSPLEGGSPAQGGDALNSGDALKNGQAPSGGKAAESGEGINGGKAAEGGEGPSGGKAAESGEGPSGGKAAETGEGIKTGEGPSGGEASKSGEGPSGGNAPKGGEGPTGGQKADGGEVPSGGDATGNGQSPDGNPLDSGAGADGEPVDGIKATSEYAKTAKKYLVTFPKRFGEILDGSLSLIAGFRIKDLNTATGNKNLYQILGKNNVVKNTNPFNLWLNQRYNNYLQSFKENKLILKGTQTTSKFLDAKGKTQSVVTWDLRSGTTVKAKKMNKFIQENMSFKAVTSKIGKDMAENWFGINNPLKWKSEKIFNRDFFKLSKMAKGNGLANVIISVAPRISEFSKQENKKAHVTDFAAGITTDVAFGVGSTAISAGAGWLAAMGAGAAAGSVVPGVGTVVGALTGIGLSIFLGSKWGTNLKNATQKGIKKLFDGVKGKLSGVFG